MQLIKLQLQPFTEGLLRNILDLDSGQQEQYGRELQARVEAAEREEQERFLLSDWRDCLDKLQDESVALVLTDPPYNIAHDRKVTRYNASDVSYDFGAWEAKLMSRRNMHFNRNDC